MKIVKSYAWYCVRHVKTSEAYQLNKKRKIFLCFVSINLFLHQHETQHESFVKWISTYGKELPHNFETECNISSRSEFNSSFDTHFTTIYNIL